jgi:mRNA interferase HigB
MRIIKPKTVRSFWQQEPQAKAGLERWYDQAKHASWSSLAEVRSVFPHADQVTVGSGKPVVVFKIGGNKYRLVTAIHYNRQVLHVLLFMTHAEYSKNRWKDVL